MTRTDRGLLLLAIILLLLTAGSFLGLDKYFGSDANEDSENAVAEIVNGEGDVRVKFNNQFQWQKGKTNQKLVYDDAIFSGENSRAEVKIGESNLNLDANTLIIIRREKTFNSLNLTRGMLSGLIAKNDHFSIETGDGEKFELNAVEATKVTIERRGTKTSVKVTSGNAQIVKNGIAQNITSRGTVEFVDRAPRKNDPLRFTAPLRGRFYSRQSVMNIEFAWAYTSNSPAKDSDEFILEFAPEPTFNKIVMRENLLGTMKLNTGLPLPQTIYYRVRDSKGNFSTTRRLVLEAPAIPEIISPKVNADFETDSQDAVPVFITMSPPQPEGRQQVQVSRDAGFTELGIDSFVTAPQLNEKFPPGSYFLRARSRFDQDNLESDWSVAVPFTVRQRVNPLDLKRANLLTHVVIPNLTYPTPIYSAADSGVQNYLATMTPFPEYFANLAFENHGLLAKRRDKDSAPTLITGSQFPAAWLYPGLTEILYRLEGGNVKKYPARAHRLLIEMEPPNHLTADGRGEFQWSPILFARAYEGRLKSESDSRNFSSRKARTRLDLSAGTHYSYQVRALGAGGIPISKWSAPLDFETPQPPPPVIEQPVVEPPKMAERKPAAEEKPSTVRIKGDADKPSIWQRVGWWLWSGTGYNFVNVKQTINNTADVEYKNTKGPSAYLEAGYMSSNGVGGVLSYKRTPGDVRVDNYPVNKKDFIWTTTSAEGLWVVPWQTRVLNFPLLWTLRAGVQNHYFPFLYVEAGNRLIQGTNQMLTGSLGFLTETVGDKIKYYLSMRYQQPMSSSTEGGNSFSVSPTLAFDGSVGASYNFTERWKTGLFWYGQLHSYDFQYQSTTQTNSGKQSLFFSNMEFRLGIDF